MILLQCLYTTLVHNVNTHNGNLEGNLHIYYMQCIIAFYNLQNPLQPHLWISVAWSQSPKLWSLVPCVVTQEAHKTCSYEP